MFLAEYTTRVIW